MAYRAPRAIPALDGLRCFGLFIVVLTHMPLIAGGGLYNLLWHINQDTRVGLMLLDCFFTLSGFLITRLLLAEKAGLGRISFKRFYARRALRILPIYYLTLVACIAVFRMPAGEIASLSTYTFNLYHSLVWVPSAMEHTWSLSVEEQFYFAWPLLVALVPLRFGILVTGRILPAISLAAALAIAFVLPVSENVLAGNLIYTLPITRMVSLSLGGWLAYRELEQRPVPERSFVIMFAASVVIIVFDKLARDHGLIVRQGFYWTLALAGYALMSNMGVGILVFGVSRGARLLQSVMEFAPFRAVGRAAYGGYLYHLPVLYYFGLNEAAIGRTPMPVARVAGMLAVTAALTALSFRYIELPLLARRKGPNRPPAEPSPGRAGHPAIAGEVPQPTVLRPAQ